MCYEPSVLSIQCFQILKLLCLANHSPYTSALHCGFSSSLLSLMNANRHKGSSPLPYHGMELIVVNPAAKSSSRTSHAVLDSLWNFLATSTQAEKGILPVVWTIPASPRRLRPAFLAQPSSLCLLQVDRLCLAVFDSSSLPHRFCSRPASPHRRHRGTSRFW
ncbi:uncharacterized protein LOC116921422 [Daphnia magna]|uniref:Uncharacterized protein n=1 Tax=Daphnia magna TaxID=35525 RepID=A0ABQ9ZD66_9CRUS|nr:uncharacterized protein LOC116921422 [Daphnia magna]KAK4010833.1 hypothetical protein OUZ56_019962 [Daphnia magna]